MSIKTSKYVRRPLYVDAVQITKANFLELAAWCMGEIRTNEGEVLIENPWPESTNGVNPADCHIRIRVHDPKNFRQTKGFVGDWILYSKMGYRVYNPKSFRASFDLFEE